MSDFTKITPRLPVPDLSRTVEFYTQVLGFCVDVLWPDDGPTFAILRRGGASVGFHVRPNGNASAVSASLVELYIAVTDARGLHSTLASQVTVEWGPEVYTYGRREFAIRDPAGHLLIFTEETDDPPTCDEP